MTPNLNSVEQQAIEQHIKYLEKAIKEYDDKVLELVALGHKAADEIDSLRLEKSNWTTLLKQKESQLTHLAGQLHTKEVEYEMMKEERKGLYSLEQIEQELQKYYLPIGARESILTNLKQQKEGE